MFKNYKFATIFLSLIVLGFFLLPNFHRANALIMSSAPTSVSPENQVNDPCDEGQGFSSLQVCGNWSYIVSYNASQGLYGQVYRVDYPQRATVYALSSAYVKITGCYGPDYFNWNNCTPIVLYDGSVSSGTQDISLYPWPRVSDSDMTLYASIYIKVEAKRANVDFDMSGMTVYARHVSIDTFEPDQDPVSVGDDIVVRYEAWEVTGDVYMYYDVPGYGTGVRGPLSPQGTETFPTSTTGTAHFSMTAVGYGNYNYRDGFYINNNPPVTVYTDDASNWWIPSTGDVDVTIQPGGSSGSAPGAFSISGFCDNWSSPHYNLDASASSGADYYEVYREDNNGGQYREATGLSLAQLNDYFYTLPTSGDFKFQATAQNTTGPTDSNLISFTVSAGNCGGVASSPPGSFSISGGCYGYPSTTVDVGLTSVPSDPGTYDLEINVNGGGWSVVSGYDNVPNTGVASVNHSESGTDGWTYQWRVKAENAAGSTYSNTISTTVNSGNCSSVTPPPPVVPPPPPAPGGCVDDSSVTVIDGLPATMTPGQVDSIVIRVGDTGNTRWYHGDAYRFIQQSGLTILSTAPATVAGLNYGHLPSGMYPGDTVDWTFNVTAPAAGGSYALNMRMRHTAGWVYGRPSDPDCAAPAADIFFGATLNIPFTVIAACSLQSTFVSQTIAGTTYNSATSIYLGAGGTYPVTITYRNDCDDVWTAAANYRLATQNPPDNTIFTGSSRADMPGGSSIGKNQQVTFSFNIVVPIGSNNFQWTMVQDGVARFGQNTPNIVIQTPPPPTGATGSCNVSGTSATISWTLPAGYTNSYVRVYNNNTSAYQYYDDNYTTTSYTWATTPGYSYNWWVHTRHPSGAFSEPVGGTVTCANPGTIIVTTNNALGNWSFSGGIPSAGSGASITYNNVTPGTFTIIVGSIAGYDAALTTANPQTLTAGGTITYNINYTVQTGTVNVNASISPASWVVKNSSGTNMTPTSGTESGTSYTVYTIPIGNYTIVPTLVPGYTTPANVALVVTNLSNQSRTLTYNPIPPPVLNAATPNCGAVNLTWNDVANETGYRLYRTDTAVGTEILIKTLGANTVSYVDPSSNIAGTNAQPFSTYTYIVEPYFPYNFVRSNPTAPIFVRECAPNMNTTVQITTIYKLSGSTWTPTAYSPSATIADGDVLRFQITVNNSGELAANITQIQNNLSIFDPGNNNLFTPPVSPAVPMPSGCNGLSSSGTPVGPWRLCIDKNGNSRYNQNAGETGFVDSTANPILQICLNGGNTPPICTNKGWGSKAFGNPNWVITFDAQVVAQLDNSTYEQISDQACVGYTYAAYAEQFACGRIGPILFRTAKPRVPEFREVNP